MPVQVSSPAQFQPARISLAEADAILLASPYWDELDDFSEDEDYGHVYHMADGSYVLIRADRTPVRFQADEQPGSA